MSCEIVKSGVRVIEGCQEAKSPTDKRIVQS